ncbi:MAG: thioredoxin domain-containing protein [Rhodopseudomonas sp.]|nr:thioredoxin domain-containing protein [Rhodopseudomonas sp.]
MTTKLSLIAAGILAVAALAALPQVQVRAQAQTQQPQPQPAKAQQGQVEKPKTAAPKAEEPDDDPVSIEAITRDPHIPVMGNPNGDLTIVEYFDYRCPYCKKVNPVLNKVVKDDGHIRLVFKDWPIFGGVSIYAARLALATKYQNKYGEAHDALISATGALTEAGVQEILTKAGIDLARAQRDLATHSKDIDALLARNHQQAQVLEFQGTPAFIIGKYRVPGALDEKNFKLAIADSRKASKTKPDTRK